MEFDFEINKKQPLADRMRPQTFDEFVGQSHIVGANQLLRRAVMAESVGNCIFYGPPGTGKTTLAHIISKYLDAHFEKMNAISSTVSELRQVLEAARKRSMFENKKTFILLDECHRWTKAQSDSLLAALEDGTITFIGSSTENPYTSMTRAIISRCRVFEFKQIEEPDVITALKRAVNNKEKGLGSMPLEVHSDAYAHFAWASDGDVRSALNALELAALTTGYNADKKIVITREVASQCTEKKALSVDESMSYDLLSAFCKSIRGSDSDAALYYSQRLILAGYDARIIARRLMAHASEDIGMADSNALLLAQAAMYAIEKIGVPEGNIPLAHAIIYACEAEKSNAVVTALANASQAATNTKDDVVPFHLRNHPSTNDIEKASYKYPHDHGGYVSQQYLPNKLVGQEFYIPSQNGKEKLLIKKNKMFKK